MQAVVLGTGLIGASIGAGLRDQGWRVSGWDPSPSAAAGAMAMGGLDRVLAGSDDELESADLVVLAAPVGAIIEMLPRLRTPALVTDVAGVKTAVVAAASGLDRFVGGHPMAGRESSGPGAATAAMFRGASWILTTDGADPDDLAEMAKVVQSLGGVPLTMSAAAHDAAVAAVSHVPQVLASALVNMAATDDEALSLAAGGFRDLTRIALSEPDWWTDVLAENRTEVVRLIRSLTAQLGDWADSIESADRMEVAARLQAARDIRGRLTAPTATVGVLLEDRPGEIARVGHALAAAQIDVRDLQLRHATRGGGGVLTLAVIPGQERQLRAAVEAEGFRLVD